MIIKAKIINFSAKSKGLKDEEPQKVGRIVLETEDLDDWQLDALGEAMNGLMHEIAIDEDVAVRRS